MTDAIILHHYAGSPFSEKVRLALGARALPWHSVRIPMIMPKPDLMPLTGGYRRTPVMQIGADIYCDTTLIMAVLESRAPLPGNAMAAADRALADVLAQWADTELFAAAVAYALQPAAIEGMFVGLAPEAIKAFVDDRRQMREGATTPRLALPEATGLLHEALARLDALLADGRPYLFGKAVSDADFSAYHPLWFIARVPALTGIFTGYAAVGPWMERIDAIGHAQSERMSAEAALEIARLAQARDTASARADLPVGRDDYGQPPGTAVTVAPTDYGIVPVAGLLECADAERLSVRRNDARVGEVLVHFPRRGFALRRAKT